MPKIGFQLLEIPSQIVKKFPSLQWNFECIEGTQDDHIRVSIHQLIQCPRKLSCEIIEVPENRDYIID